MKVSVVFMLILLSTLNFAQIDLRTFDVTKFTGDIPLVSLQRFLQTDEYVSVEGNVYKISANKKFLSKSEIKPELLSDGNFVGLLAMTIDELRSYDGKKNPAMVAVNGVVYDVSNSTRWRTGNHQNRHNAGEELTYDILKLSPHGSKLLERVVPFAVLVFSPEQLSRYSGLNKNKAYVAAFGVVYDMTQSKTIKNGLHFGYPAGNELTFEIKQQPGHEAMLSRIYPIGLLVFDEKNLGNFDGKSVPVASKNISAYKSFVQVGNVVYDVTGTNWQEKFGVNPEALAGRDYTSQFECELQESCSHEHSDASVLKEFVKVGFGIL